MLAFWCHMCFIFILFIFSFFWGGRGGGGEFEAISCSVGIDGLRSRNREKFHCMVGQYKMQIADYRSDRVQNAD